MSAGLLLALSAAALYGIGAVLQSVGAREADPLRLASRTASRLVTHPKYLAGLSLNLVAFIATAGALQSLPLFVVQPVVASSVAITAVVANVFLGESLRRTEVLLLGGLGVGLLLLAVGAVPGPGGHLSTAGETALLAGIGLAWIVGGSAMRSHRPRAGYLLALAAGLAYTGVAVAARVLDLHHGSGHGILQVPTLGVVGYGSIATLSFAASLQRIPVTTATAVIFAVETALPAVLGLTLLADRVRPHFEPIVAAGLVLTVCCLALLTHVGGVRQENRAAA